MADFETPSFSLGLDLDFDSEPQTTPVRQNSSFKHARQCSTTASLRTTQDDGDIELPALGGDPELSDPPRTLKRLRRGTTTAEPTPAAQKRELVDVWRNVDDEIEEFSSQEDQRSGKPPSMQHHSVCSSSNFPLHGNGVLTGQSACQLKARNNKQISIAFVSANMETSSNILVFPKLTGSPLRRFQLIDSDSDDSSVNEGANREANKLYSSLKDSKCNPVQHGTANEQRRVKASVGMSQMEDLWKDFCSEKSFRVPTPALDEVCEEYIRSVKDKNKAQHNNEGTYQNSNDSKNEVQQWNFVGPLPPAHCYFFHGDPRVQNLVRSRLHNFFPLGAVNNREYRQPSASVIDYMSQFSHGKDAKQPAGKVDTHIGLSRSRRNSKKSNAKEVSQGSGSWVNPECSAGIPKDAGKRRVHAVDRSAGHWYTASDGKRVYVNKNGQELTGQIAYRHYRKESGAGFKNSKQKVSAKKRKKC